MPKELFRVILPSGDTSKPYSKDQIAFAFNARKIPAEAKVQVGDRVVRIGDFLDGRIDPIATEQQKQFARELGIEVPPDITRSAISALIGQAVAERNAQAEQQTAVAVESAPESDTVPVPQPPDMQMYERVREEILTEMRLNGEIPLSKATPMEVARYFNDVRGMNMVVIFSENNAFEMLIAAADSGDRDECQGAMLGFGLPEGLTRSDFRNLLIAVMWGLDI